MRNAEIIAAYAIGVVAIISIGATAIGDVYNRTGKEDRELDAAINRILAQQAERRELIKANRMAAVAAPKSASQSATRSASETTGAAPRIARERGVPEPDSADPEERKKVARTHPNAKQRRGSPNGLHFIPAAFASIPKFTAYTLLGFR
jgi:hypothetical protein